MTEIKAKIPHAHILFSEQKLLLLRFLLVGSIGLSTNVCIVYLVRELVGLVPARVISYIVAVTVTWGLNRFFTFRSKDPKRIRQWGRYISVYLFTGTIHILAFAFLVNQFLYFNQHPIWAILMIAATIALVNFSLSKKFVFRKASV